MAKLTAAEVAAAEVAAGEAGAGWDRPRVLALATDEAARRAAAGVALGSWLQLGRETDQLLWGVCRGSGSKPYEVVVDPGAPAFTCSCPSRKSPCKHALALLLRWVGGGLSESPPADFAERWRQGRGRAVAETPRPTGPKGQLADPAAAAARAAARQQRVGDGLEELSRWLEDQLRGGLAGLERTGYAAFEPVAARMVDAHAPGVAGLLRAIPGELGREGWPGRVLERLAALHLLVEAHRRLPELPADLAATVRARIGYPVTRAEVLAGPGVDDDWYAVGQVDAVESRLETRRVWLRGRRSRRWALWLTFAVPGQAPDTTVTFGDRLRGRLHFYPGSGQYRAVVGERARAEPVDEAVVSLTTGLEEVAPALTTKDLAPESLAAARARYAALLAADPWASRMPAVVAVTPVPPQGAGPWRLRDRDGHCRDVVGPGADPWPLLARARGHEVPVVVEWSDAGMRPLAVLDADVPHPDRAGLLRQSA
ncbi:SWIM zinc finger family protein [uncultured Friedmanniella sp.]|uniref:SWIM zinc finger family protein n=1 Tax=uncultured Friedmanniella sp. TaxID=335381 RepID=UPI0035CAD8D1